MAVASIPVAGQTSDDDANEDPVEIHCVGEFIVTTSLPPSGSHLGSRTVCFDTYQEAVSHATNGEVIPSANASRESVHEDLRYYNHDLPAHSQTSPTPPIMIMAIDYKKKWFGGSTYIWTVRQYSNSCLYGNLYTVSLGNDPAWNNKISSAEIIADDCAYFLHYDNSNYTGTSFNCNRLCFFLNPPQMNNKTSSVVLKRK